MTALILSPIDAQVSVHVATHAAKASALEFAKGITKVTDPFNRTLCVSAMQDLKELLDDVEKSRKEIKAPVLQLQRDIDEFARTFTQAVIDEYNRCQRLLIDFNAIDQKKLWQAEQDRLKELKRIEDEKRKAMAEALAAEEAERKRIQQEAKNKRANDLALAETYDEKRAAETRAEKEAQRIDDESKARTEQRLRDIDEVDGLRRRHVILSTPQAPPKPQGEVNRKRWTFTVQDAAKLYAARPDLCNLEVSTARVNDELRKGVRELPGLEIYVETTVGVRT